MADFKTKHSAQINKSEHISPVLTGDNIQAKRAANYGFNPATGEWERAATGVYTTRIHEASATVTYIGDAAIGSLTSASVWRIKKVDTSSGTAITFANGDGNFDKEWDERAGYTYS